MSDETDVKGNPEIEGTVVELDNWYGLTPRQRNALLRPLNRSRVAHRQQSGKQLSYLEAWDVKRCLIRVFGFGGFDSIVEGEEFVGEYPYTGSNDTPMLELVWRARVRLTVKDQNGNPLATYVEGSVGSATVRADSAAKGDAHDNALKTAASDALKRCAINLGTQFGLSLYDDGSTNDVVGRVLVGDTGAPEVIPEDTKAALESSLGAKEIEHQTATEIAGEVAIQEVSHG